jgi:indole-3-glycerol phosphate synthase
MILEEIMAARRRDVARAKRDVTPAALRSEPLYAAPRRGFAAALRRACPGIIAEVKKASPSCGVIRADFDALAIARSYQQGGAAAISVLTEERYFQGRPEFLIAIRQEVSLPLLRKDFLFDPYQIAEARAWGADAVLLIVAALEDSLLRELIDAATELQLDQLIEVHTQDELDRALNAGATLVGVNNRDLDTFVTTLETAERLAHSFSAAVHAVAESGIADASDIQRLRACGYRSFLIGESLMRADDPGVRLRELLEESAAAEARR